MSLGDPIVHIERSRDILLETVTHKVYGLSKLASSKANTQNV